MSDPSSDLNEVPLTADEKHAALFAQMVLQSASMAMMFMGHSPNPVSGRTETNLEAARMFIDQLEMLEVKTRGNLTREEQHLLNQNLMAVRMAFVKAVENPAPAPQVGTAPGEAAGTGSTGRQEDPDDGSKKRFSKNYGAS